MFYALLLFSFATNTHTKFAGHKKETKRFLFFSLFAMFVFLTGWKGIAGHKLYGVEKKNRLNCIYCPSGHIERTHLPSGCSFCSPFNNVKCFSVSITVFSSVSSKYMLKTECGNFFFFSLYLLVLLFFIFAKTLNPVRFCSLEIPFPAVPVRFLISLFCALHSLFSYRHYLNGS